MKKLDLIKNVLDNEVVDYLDALDCFESFFSGETSFIFEIDGVEYEANVSMEARYNLTKEYEVDEYGNRYNMGTSKELRNYQFEIIDLFDWENERYLIEDGKVSEELEEAA